MPVPDPTTRYSAIVPILDLAAANAVLQKHGYGPDNFSREVQLLGVTTHYGCCANIKQSQTGMIISMLPPSVEFSTDSLEDFAASKGMTVYNPGDS